MHLIMFDLDGTLVDSTNIDLGCYLQALVNVFWFDLFGNWWMEKNLAEIMSSLY